MSQPTKEQIIERVDRLDDALGACERCPRLETLRRPVGGVAQAKGQALVLWY